MRMRRMQWMWVAVAAALLTAACNGYGDDSDDEQAGDTGEVVADDCLEGTEAYRYNGKFRIEGGGELAEALAPLGNANFRGAFVAPDRHETRIEARGETVEAVVIGSDLFAKRGNGRFIKETDDAGPEDIPFDMNEFCRSELLELNQTEVEPSKDRVNGVDALRFEFDKQELVRLDRLAGGRDPSFEALPENTKLTVWVTEKEHRPVKVVQTGDAEGDPDLATFDMEINITDLNKDIEIEPPV